jgi:hypothetical protein
MAAILLQRAEGKITETYTFDGKTDIKEMLRL